jgi:hypothetical protein
MEVLHLEQRVTHRYVGTYSHLDEWQDVCSAPVILTPGKLVKPGNDYDEGNTYLRWATLPRLPRRADRTHAAGALEDMLSSWGCHHEYDCCGCASVSTRVLRRKGRRVLLRTTVTRNY